MWSFTGWHAFVMRNVNLLYYWLWFWFHKAGRCVFRSWWVRGLFVTVNVPALYGTRTLKAEGVSPFKAISPKSRVAFSIGWILLGTRQECARLMFYTTSRRLEMRGSFLIDSSSPENNTCKIWVSCIFPKQALRRFQKIRLPSKLFWFRLPCFIIIMYYSILSNFLARFIYPSTGNK